MKKKIQLVRATHEDGRWWIVREVDEEGSVVKDSSRYFKLEDEARENFEVRLTPFTRSEEVVAEIEL